jgi:YbbR domain-containing protein
VDPVRQALTRNWELKLLSLLVACAIWAWVVTGERSRTIVPATVEYVGLARDLILVGDSVELVDLHLLVPRWAESQLGRSTVRVQADLSGLREGEDIVHLTEQNVQVASGITVVRITPARLRVSLAPAAEDTVPVVAQLRGTPAVGYAVTRVTVEPAAIPVKGPRSTMARHGTIETVPIDVSGIRASVSQTVGLMLPEFVSPTRERSVHVTVDVKPDPAEAGQRGKR